MRNDCLFCAGATELTKRFSNYYPNFDLRKAIFYQTDNFITTPDMYPVVGDPYLLLIPKMHVTSFRKLGSSYRQEIAKHLSAMDKVLNPSDKYARVMFEHGQNKDGNQTKSVYHAHLHVVYTNFCRRKISHRVMKDILSWDAIPLPTREPSFMSALEEQLEVDDDYLLFSIDKVHLVVKDQCHSFPSQFFRVLLADLMGFQFINWKQAGQWQLNILGERLNRLPLPLTAN